MTGSGEPGGLYELLGVRRDAPAAEITRAYHRRARALHPDTQPGQSGESAGFRELKEAYGVLHDPARRAAYDQATRGPAAAVEPEPPAPWPPRPSWSAARPPGATVWAGPVQIIPSAAAPPAAQALGAWLAWLAGGPGEAPGWGWPW